MQTFERDYISLLENVRANGNLRGTRNGVVRSVFGRSITVDMSTGVFPILQGRKMFPAGVLGELAAMLRKPKTVEDFKKWGCNYWDAWGDADGNLEVDYGNAWFNFNGFDQIAELKKSLANNPTDRRMIISSWRPDRLAGLSLPCCHYSYQFYVSGGRLHMIWTQRSVDMMVGLPSDIIFGAAWLIAIASEFGLGVGSIKFDLGDCHIYAEHDDAVTEYIVGAVRACANVPYWRYLGEGDFCLFEPKFLEITNYSPTPAIKLELKV